MLFLSSFICVSHVVGSRNIHHGMGPWCVRVPRSPHRWRDILFVRLSPCRVGWCLGLRWMVGKPASILSQPCAFNSLRVGLKNFWVCVCPSWWANQYVLGFNGRYVSHLILSQPCAFISFLYILFWGGCKGVYREVRLWGGSQPWKLHTELSSLNLKIQERKRWYLLFTSLSFWNVGKKLRVITRKSRVERFWVCVCPSC